MIPKQILANLRDDPQVTVTSEEVTYDKTYTRYTVSFKNVPFVILFDLDASNELTLISTTPYVFKWLNDAEVTKDELNNILYKLSQQEFDVSKHYFSKYSLNVRTPKEVYRSERVKLDAYSEKDRALLEKLGSQYAILKPNYSE